MKKEKVAGRVTSATTRTAPTKIYLTTAIKRIRALAAIERWPTASAAELARRTGLSHTYIRRLRRECDDTRADPRRAAKIAIGRLAAALGRLASPESAIAHLDAIRGIVDAMPTDA